MARKVEKQTGKKKKKRNLEGVTLIIIEWL